MSQEKTQTKKHSPKRSPRKNVKRSPSKKLSPKRSPSKGWHKDSPKKGKERHILKAKCGDKCFLEPNTEGFPICKKCLGSKCSCKIDPRGVAAAKSRARQWKHESTAKKAAKLQK